jgi:hypothetical protein
MTTFNFTNSHVTSLSLLSKITSETYISDLEVFLGGKSGCDRSLLYNISSVKVEYGNINESDSLVTREVSVYQKEKKIAYFLLYQKLLETEGFPRWSTWFVDNRSVILFHDGIKTKMEYVGDDKFIGTL